MFGGPPVRLKSGKTRTNRPFPAPSALILWTRAGLLRAPLPGSFGTCRHGQTVPARSPSSWRGSRRPSLEQTRTRVRFSLNFPRKGSKGRFPAGCERGFFSAEGIDITAMHPAVGADANTRIASSADDIALSDTNGLVKVAARAKIPVARGVHRVPHDARLGCYLVGRQYPTTRRSRRKDARRLADR